MKCKEKLKIREDKTSQLSEPFNVAELRSAIHIMQTNKSPGIDNLCTDRIKKFGQKSLDWLLQIMNNCA